MRYNVVKENDKPVSVVVIQEGKTFVAAKTHPNFYQILEALEQQRPDEEVQDQFQTESSIARGFKTVSKLLRKVAGSKKRVVAEGEPELPDSPELAALFDVVERGVESAIPPIGPVLASEPKPEPSEPEPSPEPVVGAVVTPDEVVPLAAAEPEPEPEPEPQTFEEVISQAVMEGIEAGLGFPFDELSDADKELVREAILNDVVAPFKEADSAFAAGMEQQAPEPYKKVLLSIRDSAMEAKNLIESMLPDSLADVAEKIDFRDGKLFYDGEQMHGALADTILAYHNQGGRDYTPLVKMLARILANPNEHSRTHLYEWMQHLNFRLSPQGNIIAYKGVLAKGGKLVSSHRGYGIVNGVEYTRAQLPNDPGCVVEMPREKVAFDPNMHCSTGLHIGTVDYAAGFAPVLVEVEIDPADVVSVPNDYGAAKMRVCKYRVLRRLSSRSEAKTLDADRVVLTSLPFK